MCHNRVFRLVKSTSNIADSIKIADDSKNKYSERTLLQRCDILKARYF